MAQGYTMITPKKSIRNLSQISKNSRKKSDKKSGRKQPRKRDYEVIAAPDSVKRLRFDPEIIEIPPDSPGDVATTTMKSSIYLNDLVQSDIDKLSTTNWLNDKHMNAASCLLKTINPSVNGLQDTVLRKYKEVSGDYLQIFHVDQNHWITVSTIGAEQDS